MSSYLDYYEAKIKPCLKNIDVLMKIKNTFSVKEIAKALFIHEEEVKEIILAHNIKKLNRQGFFQIMLKGTSAVCIMFKRELECSSPSAYTMDDIAYIYNISPCDVYVACQKLGLERITAKAVHRVLAQVPLARMGNE